MFEYALLPAVRLEHCRHTGCWQNSVRLEALVASCRHAYNTPAAGDLQAILVSNPEVAAAVAEICMVGLATTAQATKGPPKPDKARIDRLAYVVSKCLPELPSRFFPCSLSDSRNAPVEPAAMAWSGLLCALYAQHVILAVFTSFML